jgi:hypothetical protein
MIKITGLLIGGNYIIVLVEVRIFKVSLHDNNNWTINWSNI